MSVTIAHNTSNISNCEDPWRLAWRQHASSMIGWLVDVRFDPWGMMNDDAAGCDPRMILHGVDIDGWCNLLVSPTTSAFYCYAHLDVFAVFYFERLDVGARGFQLRGARDLDAPIILPSTAKQNAAHDQSQPNRDRA